LDKFEATKPDNAWDLFQQELDYAQSTDAIFDQQLKSKVDTYNNSEALASWDAFQEKMKQNEVEADNTFDENIKNSIDSYEAPMAENSWNQFLDYFQNYTKLRRKLYITKSIEACLILLAIFTFWNMQPQIKKGIQKMDMVFNRYHHHSIEETSNQSLANNEIAEEYSNALQNVEVEGNSVSEEATSIGLLNDNELINDISNQVEVNNAEVIDIVELQSTTESNKGLKSGLGNVSANTNKQNSSSEIKNIDLKVKSDANTKIEFDSNLPVPFIPSHDRSNDHQSIGKEMLPLETLIPNLKPIQKQDNNVVTQIDKFKFNSEKYELKGDFVQESKMDRPINSFASIDGKPLKALAYDNLGAMFDFSPAKLKHKTNLYLGTQASMDINYVFTPFDKVYNTNPYLQAAIGYSAGLNLTFEKGRWALETGLQYATKTYSPIVVEEVVGSFKQGFYGVSLKDIEIETINIPIMARYKLVHLRNWKMYGMLGGSIDMAILANYFKKNTDYSAVASTASLVPLNNANIEDKNFSDGLLEGGNLFENIYFTANAAINIERKISNRLSFYVQPSIQYNLLNTGLGPNNDRIHTASLAVGTRVQLR
jgi:hypothetical protein